MKIVIETGVNSPRATQKKMLDRMTASFTVHFHFMENDTMKVNGD